MKTRTMNLKMLVLMMSILLGASQVSAQQQRPQGPPPIPNEKQVSEMVEKLSSYLVLDELQSKQVATLYEAHFAEIRKNQKDKPSREEMESKRASFEKEVKSLLTADQQKKFDAFHKSNDPRKGDQKPPPRN